MTEIPEHLLRRSKERRAALGLGGGDAGAPPAEGGDQGSAEAAPATEPAGAPAAATPATAPAVAEPEAPSPPPPLPPYVAAATSRPRIPRWAVPVLAVLPIWALIYAGAMSAPEDDITDPVLVEGQELYVGQCLACHGAAGQGGTGRPLGEVALTFPDPQDHIAWVVNGSPAAGTPYGDPDRPGGQHISQQGWPAMPAFGELLTEEQIVAIVRYEREVLAGEETGALAEGGADSPTGQAEAEGGEVGGGGTADEGDDAAPTDEGEGSGTAGSGEGGGDTSSGSGAGSGTGGASGTGR